MSIFAIILFVLILLIVLILTIASLFFYRVAVYRQEKTFLVNNPDLEQSAPSDVPVLDTAWIDAQPFETLELKSNNGLLLKGFYLPAPSPSAKTAILAHGYTGSARQNMGPLAQMYHETLGFNVLMPDARGHGVSEGDYIGLGWHDRLDYLKWITTVIQRNGAEVQIVLHGLSMGGATVLMTSGEQLPSQVKCIIADCAYTSATDILSYQVKRLYRLPPFPFVPLTSLVCKLRAGYFFGEASAIKQVRKTTKPVLFIHGAEDLFVPTVMVHQLYAACPQYKELLIVPGAGHGTAYTTDPTGYTQKVRGFLERFIQ